MRFTALFIAILTCLNVEAQQSDTVKYFDSIIENSNTFSNKKIIKIKEVDKFRKVLVLSQDSLTDSIKILNSHIVDKNKEVNLLTSNKQALNLELETAKSKIDNINLFGIPLSKTTYNILMWGIVGLLALAIGIIVVRTRSIKIINTELKDNLEHLNTEFDSYKQISIEKQQKLARELLDVKKKLNSNK